jgi:zinc protease
MSIRWLLPAAGLALAAARVSGAQVSGAQAQAPTAAPSPSAVTPPTLPVVRTVLANGLTLLVSEDHSAPIVHVTVWYHVGSKNEKPGRTGFAHLFEHLMFEGSEHVPKGEHIRLVESAGGDMNGSTTNDRTNYYETLPSNWLETALWLESDRMGFLLPGLTQAKLDNQRDVVKNERRERIDNQPYGSDDEVLDAALFPPENPYSWPVIGSMADLSAASLDDVKAFFRTYYAPNNAVLSITGDVDAARALELVTKYFGTIPSGPPIARPTVPPVTLAATKRLVLEDRKASLPQLAIAWPTVGRDSPDAQALEALGQVLTLDRTSRLTKLLVYDRQMATAVAAEQESNENAGRFEIDVRPRPGVPLTEIERVVDSVVDAVVAAPPADSEVARAKNYKVVGTITGLESVERRGETMASGQTFFGDPLHYLTDLREQQAVTASDVHRVAQHYLTPARVVLSMVPAGKLDQVSRPREPFTNVTAQAEGQ